VSEREYEAIRAAIHDAWRLGMGTAIEIIEIHERAGTPVAGIIAHLRQRSAEGIAKPDDDE
jgi:hypothetical protein